MLYMILSVDTINLMTDIQTPSFAFNSSIIKKGFAYQM